MNYRKLWITLAIIIVASFSVLGGIGYKAIRNAPPIPERVMVMNGQTLFDRDEIQNGQNVWQSLGGQQIGSIWGHGAYVAPDWTADYLHREATFILDEWARESNTEQFASLSIEQQAALRERLKAELRTNTYDEATGRLMISPVRASAFE